MSGRREVHPIESESYRIMASRVDLSAWSGGALDVVARMVHATADESFAVTGRIGARAVDAAVEALRRGAPVLCDTTMVAAGVASLAGGCDVLCYLERAASPAGPAATRCAAAVDLGVAEHPEGAVWVVGNAPTALARLVEVGRASDLFRPAAVIGLPVGYVGAAESKQALWESGLREVSITNSGERGGSPAAAAAFNALARLAGLA